MKLESEYQKYNYFRRPDWRFERVLKMCDRHPSPGRPTKRDDDWVKTARGFLLRYRHRQPEDREGLFFENPGLFYAYELREREQDDPDAALFMQARLLTRMKPKEIADAMGVLPQAVEWYEALFFNVREYLLRRDWITRQVLVPAMVRNLGSYQSADDDEPRSPWDRQVIARPFLDASLKMFAYFGGPLVCEFLIHGFQQGKICNNNDDLAEFFDNHFAMTLRARSTQAARTFEITKWNVMELFATHTRIMELERSEEAQDHKRTTLERHVGGLIDELEGIWAVGEEAEQSRQGTKLGVYDESAVELRDSEMMLVAAGEEPDGLDGLERLELPPPAKRDKDKKVT